MGPPEDTIGEADVSPVVVSAVFPEPWDVPLAVVDSVVRFPEGPVHSERECVNIRKKKR